MEKGYNIDDILSEVKKRREEAEAQIKSDSDEKEIVGSLANDGPTVEPTVEPTPEPVEEPVESADNTVDEDEFVDASTIEEYTEEPEQADEPTPEEAYEPTQEEDTANEEELVDAQALVEQEEPAEEPFVISMDSDSERADRKEKREEKKKKKKKKKNTAIRVICILLIIILSACLAVFLYVNNALNQVTDDDNPQAPPSRKWLWTS